MVPARDYDIAGVTLTDDRYTVEQSLVRNKYRALDADGETVLRGKQKLFKMREEFPFVGPDGEEAFTVKASGIVDIAGDYVLTDSRRGEDLVVLDNDFSVLQDTWTVRDAASGERLATITSRGAAVTLARKFLPFGGLLPHRYEIADAAGDRVGAIDGQFSFRDRYVITLEGDADLPREPVVAAAMVIDAIQDN